MMDNYPMEDSGNFGGNPLAETASVQIVADSFPVREAAGGKNTTAITIFVILAVIVAAIIAGILVVSRSQTRMQEEEQKLEKNRRAAQKRYADGRTPYRNTDYHRSSSGSSERAVRTYTPGRPTGYDPYRASGRGASPSGAAARTRGSASRSANGSYNNERMKTPNR